MNTTSKTSTMGACGKSLTSKLSEAREQLVLATSKVEKLEEDLQKYLGSPELFESFFTEAKEETTLTAKEEKAKAMDSRNEKSKRTRELTKVWKSYSIEEQRKLITEKDERFVGRKIKD